MTLPRRSLCVVLLALTTFAAGCSKDEPIESYTVPRQPEPKRTMYRILGAVYPESNPLWYFKFTGTQDDLAKHEADFEKFTLSVKANSDGKLPEFTLPSGWINIGERVTTRMGIENRTDAVLKIGSKDSPLEVTLNRNEGGLAPNLVRWADQVAADYEPEKITELAAPFTASAGTKGLRVDFRGTKNPVGGGPMMRPR